MNPDYDRLNFPISHAFIIGIDDYEHRDISSLETAVNDAKELTKRLALQHGYTIHGPYLNSAQAELVELLTKTMLEEVGEEDRVLFYYAGHGLARDGEDGKPKGYLIPADAGKEEKSWVSMDLLHDTIQDLPCKHGLIILDCCFSGIFKWATGTRSFTFDEPKVMYDARFQFYLDNPAWQVITSSAHDQLATDVLHNQSLGMRNEGQADHSPFADALFEALDGKGDMAPVGRPDGVITASELFVYLLEVVKDETSKYAKMQSPSLFTLPRHDKGEFIFLDPHNRLNLVDELPGNPFKGLQSYNQEDSIYFFGRDKAIQELYDVFDGNQLTVVSGASGTGKSSVIKAGLLPRLEKEGWKILPIIRPGKEPMKVIQHELPDMEAQLASGQKLVLVVDQFEELISQTIELEEWEAFEEKLKAWLTNHNNLKIALSVRADFEPQFQGRALDPWWEKGRYRVPAFTQEEIRQVIVGPAKQAILFYEPENLVNILQTDVANAPGALPLLSFVLDQLYQERERRDPNGRNLYLEHYKDLGGVLGALRQKADKIHDSLDEAQQKSMRKLMLRMVSLEGGELASRRVYKSELDFSDPQENAHIQFIEKKMDEARLIRIGNDAEFGDYIEPAHDALVRAWAKLWDWVKKVGEEKLAWQNSLTKAVGEYYGLLGDHINKKDKRIAKRKARKQLWHDDYRLDVFKHQIEEEDEHNLNRKEEEFIQESIDRKKEIRNREYRIGGIIGAGLLALTIWALIAQNTASIKAEEARLKSIEANMQRDSAIAARARTLIEKQRADDSTASAIRSREIAEVEKNNAIRSAYISNANALAAKAQANLDKDPTLAMNLATAALNMYPSIENLSIFYDLKFDKDKTYSHLFAQNPGGIHAVAFSPDGKSVVVGSTEETAVLWDIASSKIIKKFVGKTPSHAPGIIRAVAFSPDGSTILTSVHTLLRLWDVASGEVTLEIKAHKEFLQDASFSADGRKIISGAFDRSIKVWDSKTGELQTQISYPDKIHKAILSPDATKILICATDRQATLFNVSTQRILKSFKHQAAVVDISFTPDGKHILTGSLDGSAYLWNPDTPSKPVRTYSGHSNELESIAISPDGKMLLTGSRDYTAKSWDLETGKVLGTYSGHGDIIKRAIFSPDGSQVLTGSMDRTARLWDNTQHLNYRILKGHKDRVQSLAFSPNDRYFLTGSYDGTAGLWDTQTGQQIKSYEHGAGINTLSFSPDGKQFTSGLRSGKIISWTAEQNPSLSFQQDTIFNPYSNEIYGLDFAPDGSRYATGGRNRATIIWNAKTHQNIGRPIRHSAPVTSLVFSPNGQELLIGTSDNYAVRWKPSTEKSKEIGSRYKHDHWIYSVAYSQDGQTILTGAGDNLAKLWATESGQVLQTFEGHTDYINKAIFSPDEKYIITVSNDQTARLWEASSGRIIHIFNDHTGHVKAGAFSKNGKYLLTGSMDSTAILYDISTAWDAGVYKLTAEERKRNGIPKDVVY